MRSFLFNAFDPITIISFLSPFKLACDTNGIDEEFAISLFPFFMKGLSAAVLNSPLCLSPTSSSATPTAKEWMLKTYAEVVIYLLQIYSTDDLIANTYAALTFFV